MGPGKNGPRKNGPRKIDPGKNGPREKWSRKNGSRKNGPRKIGPRQKWSSEKWSPESWSPGISETKSRGVGVEHRGVCMRNVGMRSIYENLKLGNKPKTRKQTQNTETKIVG